MKHTQNLVLAISAIFLMSAAAGNTELTVAGNENANNAGVIDEGSQEETSAQTSTEDNTLSMSDIQHVFVVVMENHSYKNIWNRSSTPYITSLGSIYARATNYHAIRHPSLPNYLDMIGGSNYGITNDCKPSSSCHINAQNLADNLEAKGLTWKGYMESMPSNCSLTSKGNYAPKHNPFVYFDDIRTNEERCESHVVPFSDLANDLVTAATTPNYAMIVPNKCHSMHDCTVHTGDTWLKNNLPAVLESPACTVERCLLILTWDEDDGHSHNQVLTIFAGSAAKTGGVSSPMAYTHFSLLRTVEDIFGLPTLTSRDEAASPMTDLIP
jgi:phosphatidylinositol-3-phosphatase